MAVQLNKALINARIKNVYDGWNVRMLSGFCLVHYPNSHCGRFLERESQ